MELWEVDGEVGGTLGGLAGWEGVCGRFEWGGGLWEVWMWGGGCVFYKIILNSTKEKNLDFGIFEKTFYIHLHVFIVILNNEISRKYHFCSNSWNIPLNSRTSLNFKIKSQQFF